jgi:hypothetical protein
MLKKIIYKLTAKYLHERDFKQILSDIDSEARKKQFEARKIAEQEMQEFLNKKGTQFKSALEEQNHVAYLIGHSNESTGQIPELTTNWFKKN